MPFCLKIWDVPPDESCCTLLLKLVYGLLYLPVVFLLRSRLAAGLHMRLCSSAPAGTVNLPLPKVLYSQAALASGQSLTPSCLRRADTLLPRGLACVRLDTAGWAALPATALALPTSLL